MLWWSCILPSRFWFPVYRYKVTTVSSALRLPRGTLPFNTVLLRPLATVFQSTTSRRTVFLFVYLTHLDVSFRRSHNPAVSPIVRFFHSPLSTSPICFPPVCQLSQQRVTSLASSYPRENFSVTESFFSTPVVWNNSPQRWFAITSNQLWQAQSPSN